MKLLLTSCGVTNATIARALFELVGKEPGSTSVAFVPTAANVEIGDKGWLIDDLLNLRRLGFRSIDLADISAIDARLWRSKMQAADVLYFGGGKRYHLMRWMVDSGLQQLLPELLRSRVYVGMSAGSMVTGKKLNLQFSHRLYGDDLDRADDMNGLACVDFSFLPHLNNPYFSSVREEKIAESVEGTTEAVYALDDSSALKVIDNQVTVITEGRWRKFGGRPDA